MKMLFGAVALATLVTSSAFAQSYAPEYGTGNVNPAAAQARVSSNVSSAYASAHTHFGTPHISGNAVYAEGRIVGQDPDPNIRFQLLRDQPGKTW